MPILYTPDEVFTLLEEVDCKQDIKEIVEYLNQNIQSYCIIDQALFIKAVNYLTSIFFAPKA